MRILYYIFLFRQVLPKLGKDFVSFLNYDIFTPSTGVWFGDVMGTVFNFYVRSVTTSSFKSRQLLSAKPAASIGLPFFYNQNSYR